MFNLIQILNNFHQTNYTIYAKLDKRFWLFINQILAIIVGIDFFFRVLASSIS